MDSQKKLKSKWDKLDYLSAEARAQNSSDKKDLILDKVIKQGKKLLKNQDTIDKKREKWNNKAKSSYRNVGSVAGGALGGTASILLKKKLINRISYLKKKDNKTQEEIQELRNSKIKLAKIVGLSTVGGSIIGNKLGFELYKKHRFKN